MPATLARRAKATRKPGRKLADTSGSSGPTYARISSQAVERATGKPWSHWLKVLDRFDVKENGHAAAARHVSADHDVGPWWSQMVVVGYEQARGLRVKHQTTQGFSVSASRVIGVPVSVAFAAWKEPALSDWMADPHFSVRKATTSKSIRITWIDGKSNVEVMFYAKGASKCTVTVQHGKLATAAAGKKMKAYWSSALDALRLHLES